MASEPLFTEKKFVITLIFVASLFLIFSQSFNALGTMIGAAIGSYYLFRSAIKHATDQTSVKTLYVGIGCIIQK